MEQPEEISYRWSAANDEKIGVRPRTQEELYCLNDAQCGIT